MAEPSKVNMKLLVNSQTNRVLFAEAGRDCVDFLFHILSLPISTVIRLLREQGMVGSLGNLYESIENLSETYIQPGQTKDALLKTPAYCTVSSVPLMLLDNAPTDKMLYKCGYCHSLIYSDDPNAVCSCNRKMTSIMKYVSPPVVHKDKDEGGFVKGVVTYMVMDDLQVKPMSTISSLTLLSKFNIKDVGVLQEKEVEIGMIEAVQLLKASLMSKRVLTEVFLSKN